MEKLVKFTTILLLAVPAAMGQTGRASIDGTVLDAVTQRPVAAALVIASRAGAPPFSRNTKSGGDGAFQIRGLADGSYSLCVQARGELYADPCEWNGNLRRWPWLPARMPPVFR